MARAATRRALIAPPSGLTRRLGVVSIAAGSRTDTVGIAYAEQPDHTVAETPWWPRDGTHLPQEGDPIVIDESPGVDPVVTAWSPSA